MLGVCHLSKINQSLIAPRNFTKTFTALLEVLKVEVDPDLRPLTVVLVVEAVVVQEVVHHLGQEVLALVVHHPARVNVVVPRKQRRQNVKHQSKLDVYQ